MLTRTAAGRSTPKPAASSRRSSASSSSAASGSMPPTARVGVCGHAHRRTAEVVVLGAGVAREDRCHPPLRADEPSSHEVVLEIAGEVDRAADRVRPARDEVELGAQPVGGDDAVRVRRRDEAAAPAGREQRAGGEVHAELAREADTLAPPLQRPQPQPRMRGDRLRGRLLRRVGAGVEHEQDLVRGRVDPGLRRERREARSDRLLLVARRHDDARLEGHEADRRGHVATSAAMRSAPTS